MCAASCICQMWPVVWLSCCDSNSLQGVQRAAEAEVSPRRGRAPPHIAFILRRLTGTSLFSLRNSAERRTGPALPSSSFFVFRFHQTDKVKWAAGATRGLFWNDKHLNNSSGSKKTHWRRNICVVTVPVTSVLRLLLSYVRVLWSHIKEN